MSNKSKKLISIADAVAAAGPVVGTALAVDARMKTQAVGMFIRFTKGSLTNITVKMQATFDGTNWHDVVGATTGALTADSKVYLSAYVPGAKMVRPSYVSTGTVTSSSIGVDLNWGAY